MKKETYNPIEAIKEEIQYAIKDVEIAYQHFNYAEPDYIDIAYEEIKSAELQLDVLYKKAKLMGV